MKTVLMVEDSADLVELARMVLETRGHKFLSATSAAAAAEILRAENVDVILMDWKLQGGGDEFYQRLQADPLTRGIPVVLVSGNARAPAIAGRLGIPLLNKPFDFPSLIRAVENPVGVSPQARTF